MPRYSFGSFLLDTEARSLFRDGEPVPLAGKTFETLAVLVENGGRLMDKDELLSRIWPGIVVEEANLSQAVFTVRKILADSPKDPRFIATVAGRGYQFIAPVTELKGEAPIKRDRKAAIGSLAVLAALVALAWFLLHRPPKPSAELIQKRLTFNSSEYPVQSAVISPDGKYLAYSDPAGIHVKLLSTGEERLIPRPAGPAASTYWLVDSWFPDGTQLLAHADEPGGHTSLWTVSLLGQAPRQLREDAEGLEVSPDGTHIAFGRSGMSDYIREIWVMGIQGDNPRKVLAVGAHEWLQQVRWSPDGQRLAYIRYQGSPVLSRPKTSIETSDLSGAKRTVAVPTGLSLNDFCWLPQGRIVYAWQDSPTVTNLWQVGMDNQAGTPIGKPKSVTQWVGSELSALSASSDGRRLVIVKQTDQGQVYVGELSAEGTRIQPPRRLTNEEAGNWASTWTADSKAVLFESVRNGKSEIYRQGISQEMSEPVLTGTRDGIGPRLSSDGAWVLFVESPKAPATPSSAYRMMRVAPGGGLAQFVLETRSWRNYVCARAPASLCVVVEASLDRKEVVVTAFDPVKGRGKVLRTIDVDKDPSDFDYQSALSPNGSTFAISRFGVGEIHIQLLSLRGGSDREITVTGGWSNMTNLDWSADENVLYCGSQSPRGSTLLHVDLKGNARVLWQYKGGGGLMAGIPSPDGRYLAINTPVTNSNVWMLEGF